MAEKQQQDAADRAGKYGGDDGALEHERSETAPGEETGTTGTPAKRPAKTGKTRPERKLDQDLETGEENPAS